MKVKAELELINMRSFKNKKGNTQYMAEMYGDGTLLRFYVSEEKANKLKAYFRQPRLYDIYLIEKEGKINYILGDVEND